MGIDSEIHTNKTMATVACSNNNESFDNDPLASPVDEYHAMAYPTAQVALLPDEDDGETDNNYNRQMITSTTNENYPAAYASSASLEPYVDASQQENNDGMYASALVVNDVARFDDNSSFQRNHAATARETYATATPLDPWSKTPTTSTELALLQASRQQQQQQDPPAVTVITQQQPASPEPFLISLEDPIHKKRRRRRRRRVRMVVSGAAGFVAGSFLGPLGAIAGAASGATLARAASKRGEKRKDRRVQRQVEQLYQQHHQQQQARVRSRQNHQLVRM